MNKSERSLIQEAQESALEVLLYCSKGPFQSLPRTAGWGYPEPYTRDLMISALGVLVSENKALVDSLQRVLEALAKNQTSLGHIPSLAHTPNDLGARDTTPLFLIGLALFRKVMGRPNFLRTAGNRAMRWMSYQSPTDGMIMQLPTTDWRDEQWVLGYGLYVNSLVYLARKLGGQVELASALKGHINSIDGLFLPDKGYYALWKFKMYKSQRFDLLGNSLAILTGLASKPKAKRILAAVEDHMARLQKKKQLSPNFPPNFFPYIQESDPDWLPRYKEYNHPGEYHNGGVWPFVGGFFVVALIAAGQKKSAEHYLLELTRLVKLSRDPELSYGFNEWIRAQDGQPMGQDWQVWSAAMYLYASKCVEKGEALLLT